MIHVIINTIPQSMQPMDWDNHNYRNSPKGTRGETPWALHPRDLLLGDKPQNVWLEASRMYPWRARKWYETETLFLEGTHKISYA